MKNLAHSIVNSCIDFILPQTCILCNKETGSGLICNTCLDALPQVRSPFCHRCGRPLKRRKTCRFCKKGTYLDQGRAWIPFIPPVDALIHFYKYRKMTILSQLIGRGMANVIVSDFFLKKSDVIAPVPLFWWKRLRRGYNQANLLAAVVGDECGIEIKHMLRRVKNTRTQTQLNEESRRKNVSDAFEVNEVNSGLIKDKIVLLIDDVLTTGATVNECARVLKEAGAKKVYSCVAAIAPG